MTAIAFISSAWGPRFGGINEFNTELCRAVGRTRKDLRVYCFTFGITESDIRSALADGVELVNIGDDPGDRPLDNTVGYAVVEHASKIADLEWWIGHDVISGRAAVVAGERSRVKVAVFQHTDYASYGSLKGTPGTVVLRRDQHESETLSRADVILGVGPKLAAAAWDRVRAGASGPQVTMLVPGLPELESAPSAPSTFRAITFGRLDPESDRIKLGRLAVRSFGELIRQVPEMVGRDPRITVVGLNSGRPDAEQADLAGLAGQAAHRSVTVVGHPFTEDRAVLLHALINSSVSLMLSVHEGFGLTGWEAIAAEVPLVLSRNSGLFDLLTGIGSRAVSCVWGVEILGRPQPPFYAKKDVKSVVEALREIAWNPQEAKNKARELKAALNHYNWSQAAGTLIDALGIGPVRSVVGVRKKDEVFDAVSDSIPPPLSDDLFVGRGVELDRVVTLIRGGSARLATVTGPPGAGKTRFVTEVARSVGDEFNGRIFYVDLDGVAEPELVAASIITALHVQPHDPIIEALKDFFRGSRSLLILDDFEHVLSAAFAVRDLLSGAPQLHILIASREALHVAGEREVPLRELSPADAVALFRDRQPPGDQTDVDDELAGEVCRSLDYLPLAIEIVAAHSRAHSMRVLREVIRASVLDLASTRRDVPEKQRSLRAAIDWSHRWLTDDESRIFRSLAVFDDGWTTPSASAVISGTPGVDRGLEAALVSLQGKNLIRWRPHGRMVMLDVLHSYAQEMLAGSGERSRLDERHARYFLALLDRAIPDASSRAALPEFDELTMDSENFEKALRWFKASDRTDEALHMCALLGRFWWSGDLLRGRTRLTEILSTSGDALRSREAVIAQLWLGRLDLRLGDLTEAEHGLVRAVERANQLADTFLRATAQGDLALVHLERDDIERAEPLLEFALDVFEHDEGARGRAGRADVIDSLAIIDVARGNYESASARFEQSWWLYDQLGDDVGKAFVSSDQSALALAQGQIGAAIELAEQALEHAGEDPVVQCWANQRLATAFCGLRDTEKARAHAGKAARLARLLGDQRLTLLALECFVRLFLLDQANHLRAITLAEAVNQARGRLMIRRNRAEALELEPPLQRAASNLEPAVVTVAQQRGRSLGLDKALAYAENS